MPTPVIFPLLNPNEPEALLAALHVQEGQYIKSGDPLCTLETTKSTAEMEAETNGYVIGLRFGMGETVRAGDLLCTLAETPEWRPPDVQILQGKISANAAQPSEMPAGLRISQPALTLARQLGIPLETLPAGPLITESLVRSLSDRGIVPLSGAPHSDFDPMAIVVYGGGGHGKTMIELLRALDGYSLVGVLDDGLPAGGSILDVPLLGGGEMLAELHYQGVRLAANAVGGIGNVSIRIQIFRRLAQAGFVCPALAHPRAYVEPSAVLSPGVQIFPYAYIGSDTRLGFGTIVNTGAIVSHDCVLGDYINISPGAILAGEVQVGERVLIGMGATINLQVKIGKGARIGNNATVKSDVPEGAVVRAGSVYPG
jgi:sugar O-acyltransferase (sialic acid O-acetyltransferase NeuD family)